MLKFFKSVYALGLICFIFLGCSAFLVREASPEFAKWSGLKNPSKGPSKIYGSYQMGCLAGAKELPVEGQGYFVVRQNRARYFGHPVIINYITQLGKKIHQKKYPMMIVEDISYPRGGPFLHGHNSHQIGLDVDISLKSVRAAPSAEERENWVSPTYVEDRKVLLPNWGTEQIQLVVLAVEAPEVNRIFIAPAIKKYFCEKYPNADWQYKLRSWWGHDDHLHVRLNCPEDSPNCKPQEALDPSNSGCGVELAWWYSAEADAEWSKMTRYRGSIKEFPKLPLECEAVKMAN